MDERSGWLTEGVAGPAAGHEDVLRLVLDATRPEPGGRVLARAVACELCGPEGGGFEVAKGECFCVGCCVPVGIVDGGVEPDAYPWRLEAGGAPLPPASPGPGFEPSDLPECPWGHGVLDVAAAFAFAADGTTVRAVSVGLKCPEDGALLLYVDNARVVPRPCTCSGPGTTCRGPEQVQGRVQEGA
ncbi:hypothetical protein ACIA6E_23195 [Streptomyces sp. NPDC051815]|uniref:hypothetical protein n=1 Tax=Streptomyces sp. NPDC051815 TaxID=3365674 RepID=UPI003795B64C